jgi:cyclase
VRTLDDIRNLLRAGADKVAINTAAVQNPSLIKEAAETFGSQCIVISVQAQKMSDRYEVLTDNGRESTGLEVEEWVQRAVSLGAGEILLTAVHNEGTGEGYDVELTRQISDAVSVPVIACGGCGNVEHIFDVIKNGHADAVSASSIFHYQYLESRVNSDDFQEEGNVEFIKQTRGGLGYMRGRIVPCGIKGAKEKLGHSGLAFRD